MLQWFTRVEAATNPITPLAPISAEPGSARSSASSPARARRGGRWLLTPAILALGALAVGDAITPVLAASTQISEGQPYSDIDYGSTRPQISPDGEWAVYRQDAVIDGAYELWSVPLSGGVPERLSEVLNPGQFLTFAISPDSERVVYTVDQDIPGRTELFSVPIDGGVITKLNPNLTANRNVISFVISPTSNRVYYVADRGIDNEFELYGVSITGGSSVQLNAPLPSDWDVEAYRVSPDGSRVVYRQVRTALGFGELWSVPALGPLEEAVKINRFLDTGSAADTYFQISPSSTYVVYRADAPVDESYNLYTVPIGGPGSASILLNGTLPGGASVDAGFLISPDGARVVYRADQTAQQVFNLYSVPLFGGTQTKLNGTLGSGEDVATGFLISPDGSRVVYRSDEDMDTVDDIWSVPLTGGTPTKLNAALGSSNRDVIDFAISPDSARVVYRADQAVDSLNELFSVPIGGGAFTKLNRTLAAAGDVQVFRISPDSGWVVYGADQDVDTVDELLGVPIAGGTVQDVNGPLASGGDVSICPPPSCSATNPIAGFDVAAVGAGVLYAADEDFNDEIDLYSSSLAGTPGAPTAVVAVPGNTQATVTFQAPSNNGGSAITGYTVTSSPAGGVDSNAGTTALTHVVTNLVNGTPYTFTVRASNIHGAGAPSAPSNSVTPATLPGAPTGVVAVPRNFAADITFVAPASNGGSPILGYTVTALPPGGIDLNAGSMSLTHYVQGLTNGGSFTFTVVALNAIGASPASAPSNLVIPGCAPDLVNVFCDGVESNDTTAWDIVLPGAPPEREH